MILLKMVAPQLDAARVVSDLDLLAPVDHQSSSQVLKAYPPALLPFVPRMLFLSTPCRNVSFTIT